MIFSSVIFIFYFLPIVLIGTYIIKDKYVNIFLLFMSLFFYAWGEPKFITIMILSILINYFIGLAIGNKNGKKIIVRKFFMIVGVILNLSLLFYFKYIDFVIESINALGFNIPLRNIVLPIGISFFTFQGMSYILDLYMGKVCVQKNILNIALYIALFPQLIAGPIVRYIDIINQINQRVCNISMFSYGIRRFCIGLSKKVIIANVVGETADMIFNNPAAENFISTAWVGAICYSLQIYFDFSGYSDMAIGLGKMLGFDFLENFNYPYISKSVTEFWRRWHISLSSWFRDYVYIPLGGNRTGNVYINLIIVFLLTGIWHGAAWNFIIWGIWYGLFLIIEKIAKKKEYKIVIPTIIKYIYTLLIIIIGWVIFRAPDLTYAFKYLGVMFGFVKPENVGFKVWYFLTPKIIFTIILGVIGSMPVIKKINIGNDKIKIIASNICSLILFVISVMFIMTSTYNPFIYFRF